ncbi:MAG: hypothetical protein ACTS27_03515 [Phycisphaerales bacterium]
MQSKHLALAACCGLVACAGKPATANVVDAVWISNTQFAYRVSFVPDFDQRRSTLPVNGSNYCVPTSFINWSAYIARRGNPGQLPGAPPWGYTEITLNINLLGVAMSTDPDGGTDPSGGVAGASNWLAGRAFCIVVTGNTSNGFPRLRTLANNAINGNCLVVPRVGWYNEDDYPVIERGGGHAVSMVRAAAAGSTNQIIGIHDPAWPPGDSLSVQSQFTRNDYAVEERLVFPDGSLIPLAMSRIMGYGGGYIYGAYYIIPYVVLTPVSFNFQIHSLGFSNAGVQTTTISNPSLGAVTTVFQGMSPAEYFYTANNAFSPGGKLARYSMADETHTTLLTLGDDFIDAVPSRFDTIFVQQGRTLSRVNPNNASAPVEASQVTGLGIVDLAYDDLNDQVVGLRPADRRLVRVDQSLNGATPILQSIPTQIPVGTEGEIDIRAGDGSVLIATPASTSAFLMKPVPGAAPIVETITIPGNTFPITGGSFTDRGVILVANGRMRELTPDANNVWLLDSASPFHNIPASTGKIYAGRSRADVDRAAANDPANADVIAFDFTGATHVAACPADINGDGVVNFTDLNAVLTSFGQNGANPPGDTDGDGDVDFSDLNTVLSNFGVDCG